MEQFDVELLAESVADRVAARLATDKRFLSIKQFAESRSIGMRTVHRMLASGRLSHQRVGRRLLIPTDATIKGVRP